MENPGSSSTNNNPPTNEVSMTESPQWAQILRGSESESAGVSSVVDRNISTASENQSDGSDNGNAGNNKKPVWNKKPSNGPVDTGAVVMGAASWPALSESTKAVPNSKLSPSDSSKSLSDTVKNLSDSGSQDPQSPSQSLVSMNAQKPVVSNANHNPTGNYGRPARQRSMKRDGSGCNVQPNGGFSHQGEPSNNNNNNNNHGNFVKTSTGGSGFESTSRDNHGNREAGMRYVGGDHHQPRNSYRRGNGGPHHHHHNHHHHGGRRGDHHDRDYRQRSFNGRDNSMQPRVSPRGGFGRGAHPHPHPPPQTPLPPPVSAPFIPHPALPMHPTYISPMLMAPDPHMLYYAPPPIPITAPPHVPAHVPTSPVYYPPADPQLKIKIAKQIDYYFSDDNLARDTYLRSQMDQNGWVPIKLVAGFKKVHEMTENLALVYDAVRTFCDGVTLQGDKIRKLEEWRKWVYLPTNNNNGVPTASPSTSGRGGVPPPSVVDTLSTRVQNATLNDGRSPTDDKAEAEAEGGDLMSSSPQSQSNAAAAAAPDSDSAAPAPDSAAVAVNDGVSSSKC